MTPNAPFDGTTTSFGSNVNVTAGVVSRQSVTWADSHAQGGYDIYDGLDHGPYRS